VPHYWPCQPSIDAALLPIPQVLRVAEHLTQLRCLALVGCKVEVQVVEEVADLLPCAVVKWRLLKR
jgi:hypothetical protein